MVFEPLYAGWRFLRALVPRKISKPHFNFIYVHYMYMIGFSIVGSIILYPGGGMKYIDALFFAAGASTQSGLNPINVNDLYLYQQIVLMLIACVCNPIFINTSVVFVRLYWFERRFKDLVEEARSLRRSRTKSFSRSFSKSQAEGRRDTDPDRLERGIAGKPIKVLHNTTRPNGLSGTSTKKQTEAEKEFEENLGLGHRAESVSPSLPHDSHEGSDRSDEIAPDEQPKSQKSQEEQSDTASAPGTPWLGLNPKLNREIMFADELPKAAAEHTPSPALETVPERQDRHIQFLERQQRNAHTVEGTLRIPGPRDFDRGEVPKEVDDSDEELQRPQTRNTLPPSGVERQRTRPEDNKSEELNGDDHPRRAITIDEPDHPAHRTRDIDDDAGNDDNHSMIIKRALSKVKSSLSHGRNRSLNLSNARGSMTKTFSSLTTARSKELDKDPMPYLSWQATIGRNSAFLGLTETQREELGGIEYRALKTLAKILIWYFVGFHLMGMFILLPWILHTPYWRGYVESGGVSAVWWGFFTPASMFNDLGFTLTPDSMNSFETAVLPLLFGSFLIIIGNTGFPCMLRFVIWLYSKFVPSSSPLWEELRFLLDHPRRCFTLLFPSKATWWLFWVLVLLNGIDLIFFIILDLNDTVVTDLAPGFRVLDGWFQATSTRTAGFSCVNLYELHPAIQVSYLIMMYISVFPIAISVRRTNVYEEKSLGIWGGEEDPEQDGEQSYVGQHLRRQLSFDLWYVFLGFFVICIVEGGRLSNTNDYAFTMFSVLFEIVSAYGTVGLSLGYPNVDTSFSAQFKVLSKLVIVAMMIRGRHRGLPYALDRAILLPSENLNKKDEKIAQESVMRSRRRSSVFDEGTDWRTGDLDESGLPRQHTGVDRAATMTDVPVATGGDGAADGPNPLRRRGSAFTTASGADNASAIGPVGMERRRTAAATGRHWRRSLSLGTVISGGLSAGPTFSKYDRD
jgi:potassium uptake Trk family protein